MNLKRSKPSKRVSTLTDYVVNDSTICNQELDVEPIPPKFQVQLRMGLIKRITHSSTKKKQRESNPKNTTRN